MNNLLARIAAIGAVAAIPTALSAGTGAVDLSFGDRGRVFLDVSAGMGLPNAVDAIGSLVVLPDGKLLAAGVAARRPALARFLPDGSVDPAFGTAGLRLLGPNPASTRSIAVQADGRIVGSGSFTANAPNEPMFLFRTDSAGNLDAAFGGTGIVTVNGRNGTKNHPGTVLLQPDGKILFLANSDGQLYITRYLPDGTLDTSYNGTGIAVASPSDLDYGLQGVLRPDGKLVVATRHGFDLGIVRYNADGTLDSTSTLQVVADRFESPYSVALQPDGKLLVGMALFSFGAPAQAAIIRLLPDGAFDPSFGSAGRIVLPDLSGIVDMEVLPDGRIMAIRPRQHPLPAPECRRVP